MDAERQRKHLTTAAVAIRSSGRAGTFSYYFPLALLLSVPLGFVAIWRKNQVMKNPDLAETLATLESLDLKTLQKLKKEGSLNGAAALFLAHRHDAYNAFMALAFWLIVTLGLIAFMHFAG